MKGNKSNLDGEPKVGFGESLTVLFVMLIIMGTSVIGLKLEPVVPILFVIMLLIAWARLRGFSWNQINNGIIKGIRSGIVPIFILILIGALIGSWIKSGVISSLCC